MSSEASSHNAGTTSPLVLHTKSYSRVQSKVIWGAGTVLYGPKSQFRENVALGRVWHRLIGVKDLRVCGVVVEG